MSVTSATSLSGGEATIGTGFSVSSKRQRDGRDSRLEVSRAFGSDILPSIRAALKPLSWALVRTLKPLKVYAYRTQSELLKRTILELTTPVDLFLVVANLQNGAMRLHHKVYGGNFLFGKAVALVDHARATDDIPTPSFRCNHFMGLDIIAADTSVFATNAPSINQCPPMRGHTRAYLETEIIPPHVRDRDLAASQAACREILAEWSGSPEMATMIGIRTAATRVFFKLLSNITVPEQEATRITDEYYRRFGEVTLLNRYLPGLMGILGSAEALRREVYLRLKAYGINLMTVEITMFAGMFSVGTAVMQAIEDLQSFGIDYNGLSAKQRRRLVIESIRLAPTVTSVHRILERAESFQVGGKSVTLQPGDEVIYPFVCINRDPKRFGAPEEFKLDRPDAELDAVLSWSAGPHECPAKELSINVTTMLLDTLALRFDLSKLKLVNLII
jgi:hypothetical protein